LRKREIQQTALESRLARVEHNERTGNVVAAAHRPANSSDQNSR
jgi:hypothetical protein